MSLTILETSVFFAILSLSSCLWISEPVAKKAWYQSPRLHRYCSDFAPINGRLLLYKEGINVTGHIVLVSSRPAGVSLDALVKIIFLNGAHGVVNSVIDWEPGHSDLVADPYVSLEGVNIPTVEVAIGDIKPFIILINNNISVFINITDSDFHPWYYVFNSAWQTLPAINCLISLALSGYAIWKLNKFVQVFGFHLSIAQCSLVIQIVLNAYRFLYLAIDPFLSRGIFPFCVAIVLIDLATPWTLITSLLISLYWQELMSKSILKRDGFLQYLKIPFIIVSLVLIAFELGGGLAKDQVTIWGGGSTLVVSADSGLFLVLNIIVTIFLIITGTRVLVYLKKSTASDKKNNDVLKTTELIMASVSGHILFAICLAFGVTTMYSTAAFWWIIRNLSFLAGSICSVFQIAAYCSYKKVGSNTKTVSNGISSPRLSRISVVSSS